MSRIRGNNLLVQLIFVLNNLKCAANEIVFISMNNIMLPKCFICCEVTTSCKLSIRLVNENIQVKNQERERERKIHTLLSIVLSVRSRYFLKEKDVRFRDTAKMM